MTRNHQEDRPMGAELKKMEERWKGDHERIAKEMGDAMLKGEFSNWGLEFLEKAAGELREADPGLSLADSFSIVMKTELGNGIYKTLRATEKFERESTPAPLSKGEQVDPFAGPVGQEVQQRKERLIEKSSGKLSNLQAYEKILKADPELYDRYVREVTVSTALG